MQQKLTKRSRRTKVALLVLAIAVGVIWLGQRAQVADVNRSSAPAVAISVIPAPTSNEARSQQSLATTELPKPSLDVRSSPAATVKAPVAVPAAASPTTGTGDRPLDIVLTAPAEAHDGNVIEIGLALSPDDRVRSTVFHVVYDLSVLEPFEVVQPVSAVRPGELEVRIDQQQVIGQPSVVRFVADAPMPRSADLMVSAEAWDAAGNQVKVGAAASHTMILWP